MVIRGVINEDTTEGEIAEELIEHGTPPRIVPVHIAVSSYKDKSIRMEEKEVLKTNSEISNFRDKFWIFPTCW